MSGTVVMAADGRRNVQRWLWLAGMVLAVAAGLALRGLPLFRHPLWLDEAYSAYAAGKGLAFLWQVVPRYETHPPFYYSLLWAWTAAFGNGLPALRLLGFAAAVLTFVPVALAAREAARLVAGRSRWTVLAATALYALAPMPVLMAREVRPYPLMILAYAAGVAALLRMARRGAAGRPIARRAFLVYLLALLLMLWLHNLGPLYAAAMGLACLAAVVRPGMTRGDWVRLVGGHAAVLLLWSPALLILLDQAPGWVHGTWLTFDPAVLPKRIRLIYVGPKKLALWTGLALAIAGSVALWRGGRRGWRGLLVLWLAGVVPLALSLLLSATVAPIFLMRTMAPVAVPALILLAVGGTAPGAAWVRGALAAVLALLGWTMLDVGIANVQRGPPQDWNAAVRWLQVRHRPGDLVLAYPNEGALPFDRAARDLGLPMRSRPVPGPIPSLDPPPGSRYVSGSRGVPSLDRPHLRAIARSAGIARVPTVWLLRLGPWAYDPGDAFLHELEAAGRTAGPRFRAGPIYIDGLPVQAALTRPRADPAGAGAAR